MQAYDHISMLRSALIDERESGDLLLAAGDVVVRAHSAFLRCLSSKLAALLATVSACSSCKWSSVIQFDEVSSDSLRAIICLLYKGEVNLALNQVSEAYDLAKVFGLKVSIEQKQRSSCLGVNEEGFGGSDVGDRSSTAGKDKVAEELRNWSRGSTGLRLSEFAQISEFFQF